MSSYENQVYECTQIAHEIDWLADRIEDILCLRDWVDDLPEFTEKIRIISVELESLVNEYLDNDSKRLKKES